jgi:hypothetical protein
MHKDFVVPTLCIMRKSTVPRGSDVTISDFTSQISDKLGLPIATGSFGDVYRCTVESSEGKTEVSLANPNPIGHTSDIHRPR